MATLGQPGVILPPIPSDIAALVGPTFLGVVVNWFLYGIVIVQLYIYYQWFPHDGKTIKTLVYGLFILDTLQAIMGLFDGFHLFAIGFGNMNSFKPGLSPFDAPMLDGIIALIVQTFFCWRIKILQKSWWLPCIIFVVSVSGLIGAIAIGIKTFQVDDLSKLGTFKWEFSLWLGSSALADTMIAVVMTYVLLRSRSRDYQQTNNILVKIVRLTVETNTVTASIAILCLVILLAVPKHPNITVTPGFALGKLYSNTLLAILNNRVYMKRGTVPVRTTNSSLNFGQPIQLEQSLELSSGIQTNTQSDEPYTLELQVHRQADPKVSPV